MPKWQWIELESAPSRLVRGSVEMIPASVRSGALDDVESFRESYGWATLVNTERLLVRESINCIQIFIREDLIDV
jgi:hypothetical protein